MPGKIKYNFSAQIWQHAAPGGWYFVSLPIKMSKEIRTHLKSQEEGWGRMQAIAKTKEIEWKSAIWFDTKSNRYVLPLKAEIRKKANLVLDQKIQVAVWL